MERRRQQQTAAEQPKAFALLCSGHQTCKAVSLTVQKKRGRKKDGSEATAAWVFSLPWPAPPPYVEAQLPLLRLLCSGCTNFSPSTPRLAPAALLSFVWETRAGARLKRARAPAQNLPGGSECAAVAIRWSNSVRVWGRAAAGGTCGTSPDRLDWRCGSRIKLLSSSFCSPCCHWASSRAEAFAGIRFLLHLKGTGRLGQGDEEALGGCGSEGRRREASRISLRLHTAVFFCLQAPEGKGTVAEARPSFLGVKPLCMVSASTSTNAFSPPRRWKLWVFSYSAFNISFLLLNIIIAEGGTSALFIPLTFISICIRFKWLSTNEDSTLYRSWISTFFLLSRYNSYIKDLVYRRGRENSQKCKETS